MSPHELASLLLPSARPWVSRSEIMWVDGNPVPWKRARRSGNRYYTDPKQAAWQQSVAMQVGEQWPGSPVEGPYAMDIIVCLPRPISHFGKHGVKPTAPLFSQSHRGGDGDNHLKNCADACESVLYGDDCRMVGGSVFKVYADCTSVDSWRLDVGIPSGVLIRFSTVDSEWRG